MFDDIGGKIKGLATFICWVGIIGSIFGGLGVMVADEDFVGLGILIILGGCLGSWIWSFFMYGFGQLIQNTDVLVERVKGLKRDASKADSLRPNTDAPSAKKPDTAAKIRFDIESADANDCKVGLCDICGREFVLVKNCTVKDSFGTWQRYMCEDCMSKPEIKRTITK